MRHERQVPRPVTRSTTRAIAWGALFFSILAFVISLATLFLCWRDGVLSRNAVMLSRELGERWRDRPAAARQQDAPIKTEKLRANLERIETMARTKDASTGYHIDSLRQELDTLRSYAGQHTQAWLTEASQKLQEARGDLARNAPLAAEKVKTVIDQLPALEKFSSEAAPVLEQARERLRTQRERWGEKTPDQRTSTGTEEVPPAGAPAPLDAPPSAPLERLKYEKPKD